MKNKAFYTYFVLTWPCLALGLSCVLAKVWLEIFQPGSKSGSGSIPGPTGWSSLHSVVQLICCGLLLSQLSCSSPRCHQLYSCERGGRVFHSSRLILQGRINFCTVFISLRIFSAVLCCSSVCASCMFIVYSIFLAFETEMLVKLSLLNAQTNV